MNGFDGPWPFEVGTPDARRRLRNEAAMILDIRGAIAKKVRSRQDLSM